MNINPTAPVIGVSRRHLMRTTSLATTALGVKPLTGMGATVQETPVRADAPGKLCLWSDRPAKTWMTEALPIGNGPMGAMLFGGTAIERVQFNEISLWTGDRMAVEGRLLGESDAEEEQNLGAYQAFGDILIHLGHDFAKVADYRQELDIDRAVHQVTYAYNGVRYQRTAFASHPDGVIVIHLTASRPAWAGDYHSNINLEMNYWPAEPANLSECHRREVISPHARGKGFPAQCQVRPHEEITLARCACMN